MQKITPNILSYDEYQAKVTSLKTASDVTSFLKDLIAPTLQTILEAEMSEHLGYKKNDQAGNNSGNSRNGYSKKKLRTSHGATTISIPRDRNADFEPQIISKHNTTQNDVEGKIIAMYAKGMTTRDINGYMYDIYGIDVSAAMVSSITDAVLPLITEWQARPLSTLYPFLYLDGIHFKVKSDGKLVTKCAYVVLGVNESGHKEVLGIWIGEAEGAKFWMGILNELKSRGVADLLIICTDGLTGFAEAIQAIYPEACIQQCIVHQVRNTLKFIPHKDRKLMATALKTIYTAANAKDGFAALEIAYKQFPHTPGHLLNMLRISHLSTRCT